MLTKLGKYSFLYHIKSFLIYFLSLLPIPRASLVLVVGQMRTGSTNVQDTISRSIGAFNAYQWVFDKPRKWPLRYLNGYLKLTALRWHKNCVIKLLTWNTFLCEKDNEYANRIDIKTIVDYCIHKNAKIVFLKRENLFNLSISEAYAWETKSWLKDLANNDEGFNINLNKFKNIVSRKVKNAQYLDRLINEYYIDNKNIITISYEDLFENNTTSTTHKLAKFFNSRIVPSKQERIFGSDKYQKIKNIKELETWYFSQKK